MNSDANASQPAINGSNTNLLPLITTSPITSVPIPIKPRLMIRQQKAILKIDHLMSTKGIALLPKLLSETRFKGKGHELEDIRLLLSKTKHWAHRLLPSATFEDFVEKAECLGNKKILKIYLQKVRRGVSEEEPQMINDDDSDQNDVDNEPTDIPIELDQIYAVPLISEPKKQECELRFDQLFKDHIDEMTKSNNGGGESKNKAKQNQSSIAMDDFALDDDDDLYDEDFLKP